MIRKAGERIVKRALTIILAWGSLVFMLSFVAAGSFKREPVTEADALPAYEILTTVRLMGLNPASEPVRRGPYYVLHAYDPRGIEVRVVADAQFGDILSVVPARVLNTAYAPLYERGPRIIQVPQPGGRDNRAGVNDRDEPAASNDDDEEDVAPPPIRRVTPKPPRRSDAPPEPRRKLFSDTPPPPSVPRRAVLSAPPPPAEGPTPIRQIPLRNSSADQVEKFSPPGDPAARSRMPPPPVGYTPPAALPSNDLAHDLFRRTGAHFSGIPGRCRVALMPWC